MMNWRWIVFGLFVGLVPFALGAQEDTKALADDLAGLHDDSNLLWLCVAAFLVFLMQAGFAYVESGFTRAKNAVNLLMKNLVDMSAGTIMFWLVGFGIMFGPHMWETVGFGTPGTATPLLAGEDGKPVPGNYGFFIFQLVFAATAATIVSGAMAERTRFYAYIVTSVVVCALIYPMFGSFAWAGLYSDQKGFLEEMGFIDFAGSTVVHSLGAWVGLAGTLVLGPRIGKYDKDGRITPIFGHNMSMAALGVFLLWFGWFGFNPGSTAAIDGGEFAIVAVTTQIAAAAGGLGALVVSWLMFKRPEISMTLNGVLAGLVAITAPCYNVDIDGAFIIGLVAGILIIFSVLLLDQIRIDDPVGAISVHGVAGAWGTLAVGIFAHPDFGDGTAGLLYGGGWKQLLVQGVGVCVAFLWAFLIALVFFSILRWTIGLRVTPEEEIDGLDILEHGNMAYTDSP